MSRIVVLGAGRVGALIARDLVSDDDLDVAVVDRSPEALARVRAGTDIETIVADLDSPDRIRRLCIGFDAVVGALPGDVGNRMLQTVLSAGRPIVDISFGPEDPLALDAVARRAGVPAVVDCGVAPGLSNLLARRGAAELEHTDSVVILVGGLPAVRRWPYEYRSVFSPTDVIEVYTRPCRFREHGIEVVRPALTEIEPIDVPGVGTLEAFNTDGLRTLLHTLDVPNLREKTLRYPGHAEKMRMLRETGFFDAEPIDIDGVQVSPRDLTERLLFRAWEPEDDETEFTVLRVVVEGDRGGSRRRITWDLLDRTDADTGETSMARTTGFPCAIVTRILATGEWGEPGVHPLENLGRDPEMTGRILGELNKRGVVVSRTEESF